MLISLVVVVVVVVAVLLYIYMHQNCVKRIYHNKMKLWEKLHNFKYTNHSWLLE